MPFRDLVGHRELVRLLARAAARETLPPSLIFAGADGVGKATAAVALTQLLNCERTSDPPTSPPEIDEWDACGECRACRLIARAADIYREGNRPAIDCLLWLAPDEKGSIKIDAVRQLIGGPREGGGRWEGRAAYRPIDGRRRVVIIDDAHALEVSSQNALLKMLEEPPSATRFVLVTSQPDALLATIRSRCPQMRFGPLAPSEIADALVCRHGWTPSDAAAAAAMADGRLGLALGGTDKTSWTAREVATDVLRDVVASRTTTQKLAAAQVLVAPRAVPRKKKEKAEPAVARSGTASRSELSVRLDAMAALLRDMGVLAAQADRRRLANPDLVSSLDALAPAFDGDRLVRAYTAVDRARYALDHNASQKVVADWLVLNL